MLYSMPLALLLVPAFTVFIKFVMNKKPQHSNVRLNEFDGSVGFVRGAGKLKEACWYILKIIFFLSPLPFPYRLKASILRMFGAHVGKGLVLKPRVNIHMPWKLVVGDNVWIGEEACLLNFEKLTIGS